MMMKTNDRVGDDDDERCTKSKSKSATSASNFQNERACGRDDDRCFRPTKDVRTYENRPSKVKDRTND